MAVLKITKENFDEVISTEKTVVLDFYADWCGPCRMLSPVIDQIADEMPEIVVGKINVDDEQSLAMRFDVTSIPTLVIMKNGEVVNTSMGVKPKDAIVALLK